jgi:hypothetical protein
MVELFVDGDSVVGAVGNVCEVVVEVLRVLAIATMVRDSIFDWLRRLN